MMPREPSSEPPIDGGAGAAGSDPLPPVIRALVRMGASVDQRDEPGLGTVIWGVQCWGLKVTDDDIQSLADCDQLRAVGLAETRVTNRSMPVLARLRHLESLDLTGTVVDDVGIEFLAGHPALEFLHVARTGVTEQGLSKLAASIPRCEIVHHEVWIPPFQSPT